jgi:hypothetical protein
VVSQASQRLGAAKRHFAYAVLADAAGCIFFLT